MLVLEGRVIPPGTYTLYLHVDQAHPELIVNKQTGQWHTVYSPSQDIVRVPARVSTMAEPVEQFTLSVDPAPGGGTLSIRWDRVEYRVAFSASVVHPVDALETTSARAHCRWMARIARLSVGLYSWRYVTDIADVP